MTPVVRREHYTNCPWLRDRDRACTCDRRERDELQIVRELVRQTPPPKPSDIERPYGPGYPD